MKIKLLTFLSLCTCLSACGSDVINDIPDNPIVDPEPENIYKLKRDTSCFADTNWKNGFKLISPESTNQYKECIIDYNGERETSFYNPENEDKVYWSMCQWWTPFNFKNATYRKEGKTHIYENESRYLGVNTEEGSLRMKLDSNLEYQTLYPENDGLKPGDQPWSHFLIQQSSPADLLLDMSALDGVGQDLYVNFDIKIDKCDYMRQDTPIGSNCAQLMFYLLIVNNCPDDLPYEEVGRKGVKMWFGIPLYDSRYEFIDEYCAGDTGFQGATGHLIYSISNREYFTEKMQMGKTYNVNISVLDYMKQGFIYGTQNGYLTNCKWQNMRLGYMNFGWELPGNYSVDSTISNLDVYYE